MFSALGLREGWLYAQLPEAERYLDPAGRGCPAVRAAAGARAGLRAGAGALDRRAVPGRDAGRPPTALAVCALSDIAWRDHPDVRAEESFRRLLQFPFIGIDHAERGLPRAGDPRPLRRRARRAWLEPAIGLLSVQRCGAGRMILGRALLLGYRFSGGVPEILAGARLRIGADTSAWRWAAPPACPTARWSATDSGCWRPPSACAGPRWWRWPERVAPRAIAAVVRRALSVGPPPDRDRSRSLTREAGETIDERARPDRTLDPGQRLRAAGRGGARGRRRRGRLAPSRRHGRPLRPQPHLRPRPRPRHPPAQRQVLRHPPDDLAGRSLSGALRQGGCGPHHRPRRGHDPPRSDAAGRSLAWASSPASRSTPPRQRAWSSMCSTGST